MSASQRRKGHSFERDIARRLRALYPDARRSQQTRSGQEGPDVCGTPLHIECKAGKRPSPRAALEQADADSNAVKPPVAVVKDDGVSRGRELVVMHWNTFLWLLGRGEG